MEAWKPRRPIRRLSPAEKAWLGLAVYVLASDTYLWRKNADTMSIQFGRWLETRGGRLACMIATGGMVAHLWWGTPLPLQTHARRYLGGQKGNTNGRSSS